jgi:hypothetical protein
MNRARLVTLALGVSVLQAAGSAGAVQTAQPAIAFLRGDELTRSTGDVCWLTWSPAV